MLVLGNYVVVKGLGVKGYRWEVIRTRNTQCLSPPCPAADVSVESCSSERQLACRIGSCVRSYAALSIQGAAGHSTVGSISVIHEIDRSSGEHGR